MRLLFKNLHFKEKGRFITLSNICCEFDLLNSFPANLPFVSRAKFYQIIFQVSIVKAGEKKELTDDEK